MLAFITSLRAKALAVDWEHHVWLLQRTLDSFLAQTHPDFRVYVVCHDVPDIPQLRHPKVEVLTVDFPPPERDFIAMTTDKAFKVSRGAERAIAGGADYVMFADADDLVSRRLSAWVDQHAGGAGWYVAKGWSGRHDDRMLSRVDTFDQICGTCAIVRADLLDFRPHPFYGNEVGSGFVAAGHPNYRSFVRERGLELQPLPFAGAIYIQHGDSTAERLRSMSAASSNPSSWYAVLRRVPGQLRRSMHNLLQQRPVTAAIRGEFSLAPSNGVHRKEENRSAQTTETPFTAAAGTTTP